MVFFVERVRGVGPLSDPWAEDAPALPVSLSAARQARQAGNSHYSNLKPSERVAGIEPASRPWQGRIIATILYPL